MTLLATAVFAACVAVLATLAVERLGGRLGGVVMSVPTTIVPASLGMYVADPGGLQRALAAVPGGLVVDALFLLAWRALPPRLPAGSLTARLAAMIAASLSVWAVAAIGLVATLRRLDTAGVPVLGSGMGATALLVVTGVVACLDAPPSPKGTRRVPPAALAARGLLAGTAVAVAVALAQAGSPLLAGVATVFPAIFLTTMVSLWVAQGEAVPVGAAGPIVLGSSSVAAYALLAAWWIPSLGPGRGAALAWVVAVTTTSLPAATWLGRRSA